MRGATSRKEVNHMQIIISIHAPHARSDVCYYHKEDDMYISIHAPHARSDLTMTPRCSSSRLNFNPRSSCEERLDKAIKAAIAEDFNPRSSCEERHSMIAFWKSSSLFQSTLLMRGATVLNGNGRAMAIQFQSTLLMRGATKAQDLNDAAELISIHAPHARSDPTTVCTVSRSFRFQSTLLMRGATKRMRATCPASSFQSTLLMRGATRRPRAPVRALVDFNPRSSCEERRSICTGRQDIIFNFNPRSSCEERRRQLAFRQSVLSDFNPRSSCEERHRGLTGSIQEDYFNPRSSCEERPGHPSTITLSPLHFNPRSSCEERPAFSTMLNPSLPRFQSTLLMRGATSRQSSNYSRCRHFNPRSSCEERPGGGNEPCGPGDFNPRSSCEERRDCYWMYIRVVSISIHAPHARSDLRSPSLEALTMRFQSTLLMRGATF